MALMERTRRAPDPDWDDADAARSSGGRLWPFGGGGGKKNRCAEQLAAAACCTVTSGPSP